MKRQEERERRRVASANVAMGSAIVFVAASALLSFVAELGATPGGARLRGALDAGSPLQAPIKPV